MAGVIILPILFSTDMTRAILEERKNTTRRIVKPQPLLGTDEEPPCQIRLCTEERYKGEWHLYRDNPMLNQAFNIPWGMRYDPPCCPGDILYVRETWAQVNESIGMGLKTKKIIYRANYSDIEAEGWKWHPSIHMPREAARIFMRVKNVEVQRLQEMVLADVLLEGIKEADDYYETWDRWHSTWDSTIKPTDRDRYGWKANPWVWVIRFERCEKPEGWIDAAS